MHKPVVAVVGAGPAGLASAIRVALSDTPAILIEAALPGGQLFEAAHVGTLPGVESQLSGDQLATILQEQAATAGVEFRFGQTTSLTETDDGATIGLDDGEELTVAAAVIATGTHRLPIRMPSGATVPEACTTHCLPCDGPLLSGRIIAFVGTASPFADDLALAMSYADRVVAIRPPGQPRFELPSGVVAIDGTVAAVNGASGQLGIEVTAADGATITVEAATIVPSLGYGPNDELLTGLKRVEPPAHVATAGSVRSDMRDGSPMDILADGWLAGARLCQTLGVDTAAPGAFSASTTSRPHS